MEVIQLLFVATQLLHLTNSADISLKDYLWETQQRWCVPQHYSCRVQYPTSNYGTKKVNQSSTTAATGDPDRSSTQQVNQSSTTVVTGDPDHSSMKHVNQSSKTAATGDTYRNSTQQVNQSLTTAATGDPDRSSTQNVNHNSPTAATDDDDHNVTHLANQSSSADITEQSACCGFCSCEDDCAQYGSCCLSEYRNLNYGREMVDKAAAKYTCVQTQFLTTDEMTDFTYLRGFDSVWLISKCSSPGVDEYSRALCENPGISISLDSIVPVTDYITHYRNIFCSRCNGLSDEFALRWGLKLHCMRYFKLSGNDILQRIVENRCNIFFKQPNYARRPRKCIPQSNLISQCNETGLWTIYNETIDLACSAYIDVFNATYKNIFCFLCNTNSSYNSYLMDVSTCDGARTVTERTPLFSTALNMDALKMTDPSNECDSATHFKDNILDVCRRIVCDSNRELSGQLCFLHDETKQPLCYVMYIKLTPQKSSKFHFSKRGMMSTRVKHILGEDISQLLVSNIYIKTYRRKHLMLVRYAVMELSVEVYSYGVDIISILVRKLHNKWHVIDKDLKLWSEFSIASPRPTKNTTNNKLYLSVWNNVTGNVDIIKGDNNGLDLNITTANYTNRRLLCEKTELIWLDHLHVCPFIRLNSTEIALKQLNGNNSLQIGERLGKTILQKWEFRKENESVLICMSTFLKIYDESGGNDSNDAIMYHLYMPMQCAAIVTVVQLTMFRLKLSS